MYRARVIYIYNKGTAKGRQRDGKGTAKVYRHNATILQRPDPTDPTRPDQKA